MILSILNFLKGRFTKESINEAKSSDRQMSRQQALQQMRNIASKRPDKKS